MLQAILYLQTFLSTLMYSVIMPSVPLYIEEVVNPSSSSSSSTESVSNGCNASGLESEEGSSPSIYIGMAVGIYPLMAAIASPPLGWWYQRANLFPPLLFSLLFVMLGNALYILARLLGQGPSAGIMLIISSRGLMGIGATSGGLARTHLAKITPAMDKDKVMVFATAFETLGLLLGPFLSGLVTSAKFSVGPVLMDQFSVPSLIAIGLAMISATGLVLYKRSLKKGEKETRQKMDYAEIEEQEDRRSRIFSWERISEHGGKRRQGNSGYEEAFLGEDDFELALDKTVIGEKKGMRGLYVMLCLSFTISSIWAAVETIMVPSTCRMYQWGVKENSFLMGGSACVCALVFVAYLLIRSRCPSIQAYQRHLYLIAVILLALGNGLLINVYPSGSVLPLALFLFSALGPLAVGFALCQALGYSLYMLLVPPGTEGVAVGWQTSVNFLARFLGPLVSSGLADVLLLKDPLKYGSVAWIFNTVLLATATVLIMVFWTDLWNQTFPQEESPSEAGLKVERSTSGSSFSYQAVPHTVRLSGGLCVKK